MRENKGEAWKNRERERERRAESERKRRESFVAEASLRIHETRTGTHSKAEDALGSGSTTSWSGEFMFIRSTRPAARRYQHLSRMLPAFVRSLVSSPAV